MNQFLAAILNRYLILIAFLLVANFVSVAIANDWIVETTNEEFHGQIDHVSLKDVVLQASDASQTFHADELLSVRRSDLALINKDDPQGLGEVLLTDGSIVKYTTWELDEDPQFMLFSGIGGTDGELRSANLTIHAWRLPGTTSKEDQIIWQELIKSRPVSDQIVIRRRSTGELRPVEGVIEEINREGVRFRLTEVAAQISWDRIFGIVYFQQEQQLEPQQTSRPTVVLADGSRLIVKQIRTGNDRLSLVTLSGGQLMVSFDSLRAIDFSADKVFYLPTLPVVSSNWKPPKDSQAGNGRQRGFSPRFNENFHGRPLSLLHPDERLTSVWKKVEYEQGIALRSGSRLVLELPEETSVLKGLVGIDPATRRAGSAVLVVQLNGKPLARFAIDGGEAPREIRIELPMDSSEQRALTLIVESGDNGSAGDNVHLVNVSVTK